VEVCPFYPRSDDWLINNIRRAEVAWRFMPTTGLVAFLDLDCWIRGDLLNPNRCAFGTKDSIAVTRFFSKEPHTGGTITDGTWYANVDQGVLSFLKEWDYTTRPRMNEYNKQGMATTQQYVFTELCRRTYASGHPCKIIPIDECVYNCEHSVRSELEIKARVHSPQVIHFKGGSWKDRNWVRHILACAEGKA
jgi:hypothetical protein